MATSQQVITSTQSPWVPPADYDDSVPIIIEMYSFGGVGQDGGAVVGGDGGGGAGYAKFLGVTPGDPTSCDIGIVSGDDGQIIFYQEDGRNRYLTNGRSWAAGGTGADDGGNGDFPADLGCSGGNGGTHGTTGGGGGGESGGPTQAGANGDNGATTSGGEGGTGHDGEDGGRGGDALATGTNGSGTGAGLGGSAGSVGGGGGGGGGAGGRMVITYTTLIVMGLSPRGLRGVGA